MVRFDCCDARFEPSIEWLPGKERHSIARRDGKVFLRFKVVAAGDDGRDAVEMLLATVSRGSSADVEFFLEMDEDDEIPHIGFTRGGMRFLVGSLPESMGNGLSPGFLAAFAGVKLSCFGVELSTVAREVDRCRLMRMADDIEFMTDGEFSELMTSVSGALMADVYTVKFELENVPVRSSKGVLNGS